MDPQIELKIRDSFARQSLMQTFDAEIQFPEHGRVHITAPLAPPFIMQNDDMDDLLAKLVKTVDDVLP